MRSVLFIATDATPLEPVAERLGQRGYGVRIEREAETALAFHREEGAHLVILSLPVAGFDGAELMASLRRQDPRVLIVIVGHDASIPGAPEAMDAGAYEYLAAGAELDAMMSVVGMGLSARKSDAQLRYLRKKDAADASWETIVGQSDGMQHVFATVRQLCQRTTRHNPPVVLVTGETGTGKGLIAKAIHYNSTRRSRAIVSLNCAAIPATLIESELFGHERGAFTDARTSRAGLFETADEGTLFLDEIGAMPLALQSKLLTAIEERTIRRLGASEDISVSVQLIAATHRDLASAAERGEFRADLFHRINVVTIELPPLRERGDDVLLLANTYLRHMGAEYGLPPKTLSAEAQRAIQAYDWPGNVRELRNQIERIVLLEDGSVVRPEHFHFASRSGSGPAQASALDIDAEEGGLTVSLPEQPFSLDALEREVIRQALSRHQGNVSQTARYLGITRHTLMYRLRKYELSAEG